jgi:hypothetical protein
MTDGQEFKEAMAAFDELAGRVNSFFDEHDAITDRLNDEVKSLLAAYCTSKTIECPPLVMFAQIIGSIVTDCVKIGYYLAARDSGSIPEVFKKAFE